MNNEIIQVLYYVSFEQILVSIHKAFIERSTTSETRWNMENIT